MIATVLGFSGVVPASGLSTALDYNLLTNEVAMYQSQLGLPEETYLTSPEEIQDKLKVYVVRAAVEEFVQYTPFVGSVIAGSSSFASIHYFLNRLLDEMERTA